MFEASRFELEVYGEPSGIPVWKNQGYTFHASAEWASPLEVSSYTDIQAAEFAVRAVSRSVQSLGAFDEPFKHRLRSFRICSARVDRNCELDKREQPMFGGQ